MTCWVRPSAKAPGDLGRHFGARAGPAGAHAAEKKGSDGRQEWACRSSNHSRQTSKLVPRSPVILEGGQESSPIDSRRIAHPRWELGSRDEFSLYRTALSSRGLPTVR